MWSRAAFAPYHLTYPNNLPIKVDYDVLSKKLKEHESDLGGKKLKHYLHVAESLPLILSDFLQTPCAFFIFTSTALRLTFSYRLSESKIIQAKLALWIQANSHRQQSEKGQGINHSQCRIVWREALTDLLFKLAEALPFNVHVRGNHIELRFGPKDVYTIPFKYISRETIELLIEIAYDGFLNNRWSAFDVRLYLKTHLFERISAALASGVPDEEEEASE